MLKKRKIFVVALLLFVHVLVLFHEVAVNPVLCYKKDGSVDLEMALFDYQCFCTGSDSQCCKDDDHNLHPNPQPGIAPQVCAQFNNCWDQPFNSSWLEREKTPGTENIHFVKLYDLNIKINIQLDDAFGCFFDSVPLSKYLDRVPSELNSVILRC
jgi:hypothetical protein